MSNWIYNISCYILNNMFGQFQFISGQSNGWGGQRQGRRDFHRSRRRRSRRRRGQRWENAKQQFCGSKPRGVKCTKWKWKWKERSVQVMSRPNLFLVFPSSAPIYKYTSDIFPNYLVACFFQQKAAASDVPKLCHNWCLADFDWGVWRCKAALQIQNTQLQKYKSLFLETKLCRCGDFMGISPGLLLNPALFCQLHGLIETSNKIRPIWDKIAKMFWGEFYLKTAAGN